MELLHIKLRALSHPAPQNRSPFVMHLQHMTFSFFARISKHPLEYHRHITHQIYRIVMHDDQPREIEIFLSTRVFFDRRLLNSCRPAFLTRCVDRPL